MAIFLDRSVLAAAYDYLNTTDPFRKWNLPPSEDVKFKVVRSPAVRGWYRLDKAGHVIAVSSRCIGHTLSLMAVMGHEMIHLHEAHAGACGRGEHSAAFNRWAEQVCRAHGFDHKLF